MKPALLRGPINRTPTIWGFFTSLLVQLRDFYYTVSLAVVMAAISLAVIPVLIIFIFTQKYLIEGIALTGLKG